MVIGVTDSLCLFDQAINLPKLPLELFYILKENIPLFAIQAFENIVRDSLFEMEKTYKSS